VDGGDASFFEGKYNPLFSSRPDREELTVNSINAVADRAPAVT